MMILTRGAGVALLLLVPTAAYCFTVAPSARFSRSSSATQRCRFSLQRNTGAKSTLPPSTSWCGTTRLENSKRDDDDDDFEFDSLDVVLERARQRNKFGLQLTKLQAILSKPVSVGVPLTLGDAGLVLAGIAIGSTGFAIGWIAGKLSASSLPRNLAPPPILQLWPVCVAILCDQLLF